MKFDKSVFIGRMQPVHRGHVVNIEKCLEISDQTIIILGSSHTPISYKNPFGKQRVKMILSVLYELGWSIQQSSGGIIEIHNPTAGTRELKIVEIKDNLYSDSHWVQEVQQAVSHRHGEKVALVGHDKDGNSSHLSMFPQWEFVDSGLQCKHEGNPFHASDFRNEFFEQGSVPQSWEDSLYPSTIEMLNNFTQTSEYTKIVEERRYLIEYPKIWGVGPFVTTDCVVTCAGHVLMIKRGANPGKGNLALPGGFLDPSETFEEGAIRELKEETKIKVPRKILQSCIKETHLFDHPNRSARGRVITNAFFIELQDTVLPRIKAGDDAAEALWVTFNELEQLVDTIHEDHYSIIKYFL